jgi:hypothetical protein
MTQSKSKGNRSTSADTAPTAYELETGKSISSHSDKLVALELDALIRATVAKQGGLK